MTVLRRVLEHLPVSDIQSQLKLAEVPQAERRVPLKTEKDFKVGLKKMGYIIQNQGIL